MPKITFNQALAIFLSMNPSKSSYIRIFPTSSLPQKNKILETFNIKPPFREPVNYYISSHQLCLHLCKFIQALALSPSTINNRASVFCFLSPVQLKVSTPHSFPYKGHLSISLTFLSNLNQQEVILLFRLVNHFTHMRNNLRRSLLQSLEYSKH